MPNILHSFVDPVPDQPGFIGVKPTDWNAVHTDSHGNTLTVRTILTAATNYYVATTGSDSNDGSIGSPWFTIAHAYAFIARNVDVGGKSIVINVGAGTFTMPGRVPGMSGGGIVELLGAGYASTTIDGGGTTGFYFNDDQAVAIAFDGATFTNASFSIFGTFSGGLTLYLYDIVNGAPASQKYVLNGGGIVLDAATICFIGNNGGTYIVDGTGMAPGSVSLFEVSIGSTLQDLFTSWTFTNSPAFGTLSSGANGFITVDFGGTLINFSPTFTGAATGTIYIGFQGGVISFGGNPTPTPPAGTTLIEVDSITFGGITPGQGFLGGFVKSGLPAVTDLAPSTWSVFKDIIGGGVYVAYNDAGIIKKVALV